jgi:hypothetical protein
LDTPRCLQGLLGPALLMQPEKSGEASEGFPWATIRKARGGDTRMGLESAAPTLSEQQRSEAASVQAAFCEGSALCASNIPLSAREQNITHRKR